MWGGVGLGVQVLWPVSAFQEQHSTSSGTEIAVTSSIASPGVKEKDLRRFMEEIQDRLE